VIKLYLQGFEDLAGTAYNLQGFQNLVGLVIIVSKQKEVYTFVV
jgi:hypothetical protein